MKLPKKILKVGRDKNMNFKKRASAKSTLEIGGVSSPLDSFVLVESFMLRMNICGKNPIANL